MTFKEKLDQLELEFSNRLDAYIELRDELCEEIGHCSTIEADQRAKINGNQRYFEAKEAYLKAAAEFSQLRTFINDIGIKPDTAFPVLQDNV